MKIDKKNIQKYDFIFSSIPLPVIIVSDRLKILYTNTYFEKIFQKISLNIIGKDLDLILSDKNELYDLIKNSIKNNFSFTENLIKVSLSKSSNILVNIHFSRIINSENLGVLIFEDPSLDKVRHQFDSKKRNLSLRGFSSLLSHEIKTPLASITGAIQLIERNVNNEDKKFISIINSETKRIVDLVNKMSFFDKDNDNIFENINIHDVLINVIKVAKIGYAKDINFVEFYDPSLPNIKGNRGGLVQLFTNLIKNSVESMNNFGDINITTSFINDLQQKLDKQGNIKRAYLPIEISIKDTGKGIPKELSDQIFDPFITSKFDGSGLGLPLALKIVSDHNGSIDFETTDQYTVFSVRLPIAY